MRHVYLHVPFCARRCVYCDFAIAVRKRIPADRYVAAIRRELALRRESGEWDEEPVETLYFGGGTPSLLPPDALADLIGFLVPAEGVPHPLSPSPIRERGNAKRTPAVTGGEEFRGGEQRVGPPEGRQGQGVRNPEITLEANPDDVTPERARAWVSAGVTRLSIGVQSFNDPVLQWMHRTHDAAAAPRAVAVARQAGIAALSLDLIFGLPAELGARLGNDLDRALALAPDHLSVYGLSVEARTPLARWISRGAAGAPSDHRYAREFLEAHEVLTRAGYEHYEVSNYSRPGRRSRHNSAYWLDRAYGGLGPAAHSFLGSVRRWNLRDWAAYDRAVSAGADPAEQRESLTAAQRRLERLYLSLRTAEGLELAPWWSAPPADQQAWTERGWVRQTPTRYQLTPEGWLYLDEIVSALTTSGDSG